MFTDVDYFKYTNNSLKSGDYVTFKIHYYGAYENPFGYKWSMFCGTSMVGSGSLISQDQKCKALVTSGNVVYLGVYYDQSRSEYFNYGEEFVAEIYINGKSSNEVTPLYRDSDKTGTIYDLRGHKKENLSKGLNIVRSKDGKTRKVIMK